MGDVLKRYSLTNGQLSPAPVAQGGYTSVYPGATPSISSNGTANGIVWDVQYNASHAVLHAYDATTLTELYNSSQNAARDQMGVGTKFVTPTIADGEVFVGSNGALTIYGLLTPPTTPPAAPTSLTATSNSASSVTLNWVNNATNQSGFKIERSTGNASNFAQIAVAGVGALSFTDTTVNPFTQYYYRIRATNAIGDSAYSNNANATTLAATVPTDIYHFDEGSGTTTADSAGTNNGTLVGATLPQWVTPGKIGTAALSFSGDGVSGQTASESAVKLGTDLSPVLGSTSTLDVWINTTQVGSNTHWQAPAITGVEQAGADDDINWGTINATGHIGIYVGDAGGVYSTSALNDGTWHNIAMTRDASTGIVQLYVDGVLNGSATFDTGNKTSQFFLIGALSDVAGDGITRTGDNYFNGKLDEVRIYNQVLSANEIAGLAVIPAAPTLTSATAASSSVIQVTWTVPSSFTQYIEVDRKTGANGSFAAVATLAGNATSYMDANVSAGVQYFYQVKAIDLAGSSPPSNALGVSLSQPTVVGEYVFYNNSTFDGQNGSSNLTDDSAIATDKTALLPGGAATFANYTSYSKGLNGVMVDVANLVSVPRIDDFAFAVGNNNNVGTWTNAPSPTYVNAYPGRGPGGSTQITIIWDDNAIENEWLKVTMLADDHTGLPANVVFYFGNAIGETGDSGTNALTTSNDAARVAANFTSSASVTNLYDINRDGIVNSTDVGIVNSNLTTASNSLQLISFASPPTVAMPASASPSYITGTATTLRVLGGDAAGESRLTYTWATIGTPPAIVSFSDNGTNSAKTTTATFTQPGLYNFRVTISDTVGSTVTDAVSVIVAPSLAAIAVTPAAAAATVPADDSMQQFSASGLDQFSQPIAIGSPTWSVVSGGGSINSEGLYTPPYADGSATVLAAIGAATGTATVTYSGQAVWNSSTSGSWNTNSNWMDTSGTAIVSPGVRGLAGDTVLFDSAAGNIARLDGADPSLAAITFNNLTIGYTIAQGSGGALTLQAGGAHSGSATVSVLAGNDAISAPLHLATNTVFSIASASSLTVSGAIDGSGSLTVNGGGKVYLSGSSHYVGDTSVAGGTLIITTAAALPDGGNIAIGSISLFVSAGVASSEQVGQAAASPALMAGSAVALLPAKASNTTSRFPTVPLVDPSQLQSTSRTVNNGPALLSANANGLKLAPPWLAAITQFWNEQRQSVGPANARAVELRSDDSQFVSRRRTTLPYPRFAVHCGTEGFRGLFVPKPLEAHPCHGAAEVALMRSTCSRHAAVPFAAFVCGVAFVSRAATGICAAGDIGEPAREPESRAATDSLKAELDKGDLWGEPLAAKAFSQVPLTKSDAAHAKKLLWQRHAERITNDRAEEIDKGVLRDGQHAMHIFSTTFGKEPKDGWSLWISMHGGGNAPASVNDQQWENQKHLYKLDEGIYVAPRAPTDTWNLWHEPHIDALFNRLIEDLIVLKHVDPNRVYIMGYSAGGDGVYQLAPRMADAFAAAAMMAGHPNDASWLGLRNVGFAIQVGALDSAYNRNKVARQWIDKLDELQKADRQGYVHFGKIHEGKAHWMDRQDAKVLPWMAAIKRNPVPERVVWKQSSTTHDRLYWLALPKDVAAVPGALVIAERDGQTITIESAEKVDRLMVRLDDRMVDLDRPVRIVYKGKTVFEGRAPRTIAALIRTLEKRGDRQLMFDADVEVKLPASKPDA